MSLMNMALKQQFAKQYANTQVETTISEATPHKLVEALYDGLLKNLILTKTFMDQKNFEKKSFHVNKCLSILTALKDGVDAKNGGEIADNFLAIYNYCYRMMVQASTQNDVDKVDEIYRLMKGIAAAWKEMPDNIKRATEDQLKRISA